MGIADYDFVLISDGAVLVTSGAIARFKGQWPCSGLPDDMGVIFTFDHRGNLCGIDWFDSETGVDVSGPENADGPALAALSQDAQTFRQGGPSNGSWYIVAPGGENAKVPPEYLPEPTAEG